MWISIWNDLPVKPRKTCSCNLTGPLLDVCVASVGTECGSRGAIVVLGIEITRSPTEVNLSVKYNQIFYHTKDSPLLIYELLARILCLSDVGLDASGVEIPSSVAMNGYDIETSAA